MRKHQSQTYSAEKATQRLLVFATLLVCTGMAIVFAVDMYLGSKVEIIVSAKVEPSSLDYYTAREKKILVVDSTDGYADQEDFTFEMPRWEAWNYDYSIPVYVVSQEDWHSGLAFQCFRSPWIARHANKESEGLKR